VIVLQHPIGADDEQERLWMSGTLAATRRFSRLVMMPNGDAGRAGIVEAIARERMGRGGSLTVVDHLPRERWLGLVRGAKVIVGNSSAGLIEACGLRTACVNVGPRQGGRQRPGHVIDCDYGAAQVAAAIDKAMKLDLRRLRNPYGDGRAGQRIAKLLATMELGPAVLRKRNSY
jgi:UDP-N-acetylglucosamine 2-epimerase